MNSSTSPFFLSRNKYCILTKSVALLLLTLEHIKQIQFAATALSLGDSSSKQITNLPGPAAFRLMDLLQREMNGERDSELPILLPCCYDGLTARLVARAGFEATFMTGFGVSGQ